MKMNDIQLDFRPREKLVLNGVKTLSDAELLAIMLGSGTKEYSVLELANNLINEYGLSRLLNMGFNELSQIKGIKMAKATKLMACFEISRRCAKNLDIKSLTEAVDVFEYVKSDFLFLEQEIIVAVFVDSKFRPIKKIVYESNLSTRVNVPFRNLVSDGILLNAYAMFIAHNHPSGDINPSNADISTTFEIIKMFNHVDIRLLDHLIIYKDEYYSFAENGIIVG